MTDEKTLAESGEISVKVMRLLLTAELQSTDELRVEGGSLVIGRDGKAIGRVVLDGDRSGLAVPDGQRLCIEWGQARKFKPCPFCGDLHSIRSDRSRQRPDPQPDAPVILPSGKTIARRPKPRHWASLTCCSCSVSMTYHSAVSADTAAEWVRGMWNRRVSTTGEIQ